VLAELSELSENLGAILRKFKVSGLIIRFPEKL
jgi:hypothetical protein